MTQESEIKVPSKFQNSDMLKSLEGLLDETLQVYEFNNEEENAIGEICDTIGMMLIQMKTSISISPDLVAPNNTVKRAILNQNGQIMIMYRDDEVEYKKLTNFRSGILIDILNDLFPKLKEAAVEYRKHLEERLSLYRATSKKMKKIEKVFREERKIGMEDITKDDSKDSA